MVHTAIKSLIAIVLIVALQQSDSANQSNKKVDGLPQQNSNLPAADQVVELSTKIGKTLQQQLELFPEFTDDDKKAVDKYSQRGDLHMFLGHFAEAEADYQKMVTLNPESDASHWRLGIAKYFAGHPEQAAAQFDRYHSFDNVDRENGIWRYLSHHSAFGKEKAREQLLKYEKDDRPPFREVYQLFDGTMSPEEVLKSISPDLPEASSQSRLFYAHLYIGMNHVAEGQKKEALKSLREATLNGWPEKAGFGPNYMWHVGRLQYLKINQK